MSRCNSFDVSPEPLSGPLASLEKVCAGAEYATEPDRFLAFVAEWARLRREMGAEAFWAAVDAELPDGSQVRSQTDRRCDDVVPPDSVRIPCGLRADSVRTPCGLRPESLPRVSVDRAETRTVGGPQRGPVRGRLRGPDTPSDTPSHGLSRDAGVTRHVTQKSSVTGETG